jgi:hypothetical protein
MIANPPNGGGKWPGDFASDQREKRTMLMTLVRWTFTLVATVTCLGLATGCSKEEPVQGQAPKTFGERVGETARKVTDSIESSYAKSEQRTQEAYDRAMTGAGKAYADGKNTSEEFVDDVKQGYAGEGQ